MAAPSPPTGCATTCTACSTRQAARSGMSVRGAPANISAATNGTSSWMPAGATVSLRKGGRDPGHPGHPSQHLRAPRVWPKFPAPDVTRMVLHPPHPGHIRGRKFRGMLRLSVKLQRMTRMPRMPSLPYAEIRPQPCARAAGEGQTPAEAAGAAETLASEPAQPARTKRRPRVQPSKPPPEPQQIDLEEYVIGVLPETIRQLRRDNPNRSLRWLAQRTGQPKSYIKEVLGIAGDGAAACAYCGEAIAETKPGAGG